MTTLATAPTVTSGPAHAPVTVIEQLLESVPGPLLLIMRIALPDALVCQLLARVNVAAIVLPAANSYLASRYPGRIGCYDADQIRFALPARLATEVLYFGSRWSLNLAAARALRRAGVVHLRFFWGGIPQSARLGSTALLLLCLGQSLLYRTGLGPLGPVARWITHRQIATIGRRLRTALTPSAPAIAGRIILITGGLGAGGSERQVVQTLRGLAARGATDLTLCHLHALTAPNDFFLPQLTHCAIKLRPFAALEARTSSDWTWLGRLGESVQALQPDSTVPDEILGFVAEFNEQRPAVVHTWLDHINITAGLAAAICHVPKIVLGCRSMAPRHFAFHQPYMRPLYRLLASYAQVHFVVNSHAGARDYARWLGLDPARFTVIHNGFEFDQLTRTAARQHTADALRQQLAIAPTAPVVGTAMRFSEEKRPDLWLQAAAVIAQQLPQARFIIAGDGPLRAATDALCARLGLTSVVHFLGTQSDIVPALVASDVVMLTSRIEGLPNVLIEAQALGVAVVAAAVGGAAETFAPGATGIVPAGESANAYAAAAIRLLGDTAWRQRVHRSGPDFVRRHFALDRMIDQTLAVYAIAAANFSPASDSDAINARGAL